MLIQKMSKVWTKIKLWKEVSKQRSDLKNLSDHFLKDIGISRVDAEREASRPFWDIGPIDDTDLRKRGNSNQHISHEIHNPLSLEGDI